MRKLVGLVTAILLPIAVIVVAFKYAMNFIEDQIWTHVKESLTTHSKTSYSMTVMAEKLEERANEWCKWNDKRMVTELRMVAEDIRGELNETN